jgi:hypothetical protein
MAARAGIEPVVQLLQVCVETAASEIEKSANAQIGSQKVAELRFLIKSWSNLPLTLRAYVVAHFATKDQ